jgi:hypothetical protein
MPRIQDQPLAVRSVNNPPRENDSCASSFCCLLLEKIKNAVFEFFNCIARVFECRSDHSERSEIRNLIQDLRPELREVQEELDQVQTEIQRNDQARRDILNGVITASRNQRRI